MFISDFAIRRPIVTVTAMVALVVFGIFSLINIQTDEFPDVQQPLVVVTIPYPGASPSEVTREIVDPIEDAVFAISGIDGAKSTCAATDGLAQCQIFFDFEKPVQQASQDIRDAISARRSDLPPEMEEPILSRIDPGDMPVMTLTLTSASVPGAQLTRLADPALTKALRSIGGVGQVDVVGGIERELTVELKPEALQASGVGVAQVVAALQAQNLAAPVGRVTGALEERSIRLRGRLEGPADFAQLVVAERGGQVIRLGQLADVKDGTEEPRTLALFNGREAVGIEIRKSKGYSTTAVSDRLREAIAEQQERMPEGVKLEIVQDAGQRVEAAVDNVQEALLEGALLTVLVVFVFLNSWRSTVITGLALPVSVLASFIAVWAFGFTLNTMSLLGLSLAIGILIDDAIVVRENIVRHIEMGKDHLTASHEGTDEIGLAVAATTFSIVAVFVPIGFMYGVAGQWFKPFALTIACSVLVSLFVSFSLDPMLSAYWADPQTEAHERRNFIARTLDRFNKWFDRQTEGYARLIGWALDHRLPMVGIAGASFVAALAIPAVGSLAALALLAGIGAAVWIMQLPLSHRIRTVPRLALKLVGVVAVMGVLGALMPRIPVVGQVGGSFVPVSDRSEVTFIVETPPGSSLEYTRIKTEEVARIARQLPEVAYTYTAIGTPLPFYSPSVDQASVYVRLVPKANRGLNQEEVGQRLRRDLVQVGGVTVSVFTSGFGGAIKQVQFQLSGEDPVVLTRLAQQTADLVRSVPGAVDVGLSTRGEKPELDVQLNRGLAGSLGITAGQVAQSLRPAFAGIDAGDWVDPTGETRDVEVRLSPEARERASDLERLPLMIQGADGRTSAVPLGQIATIRPGFGPAQINHLNREAVVTVQANVSGASLNEVTAEITRRVATEVPMPPGYEVSWGGETRDQQEVFTRIFTALATAVLLMYLILVVQFGSFLDPLAILVSLPLSLIGVVLALLITGDTLNIMSMIGVILLMGIVAKNAILLIDFAKWQRERGMELREALIEAGRIRLRPIIMTTVALIAGMIPVALGRGEGADFRAPLGRAVIGGVITSTLLTLIVIPTVYEILDNARERAIGFFRKRMGNPAVAHGGATPGVVVPRDRD